MKKINKFIDFEIITILTILILIFTFYLTLRYSEIENDICYKETFVVSGYQILINVEKKVEETDNNEIFKVQIMDLKNDLLYASNSDFELIGIITAIINVAVIIIYIMLIFIKILKRNKNKKILSKIDEIELPQYDVFIANTLYTGRISFSKIYNFLGEYFRKKEMIDIKGKINPNVNINNLSDFEKEFIYLYEKDVGKETKEQFKDKIVKELNDREYLKNSRLRIFLESFGRKIDKIGLEIYNLDRYDIKRTFIEAIFPFVLLLLIAVLKYFSILLIISIAYIQLKYYTIFLSEEGKREKARITLLVELLKDKEELTEKERFFYNALKYINL